MADIAVNISEAVYQIKRWRGVNEALEGEASLQMGEAAVMRNFKVTSGGALQKRGGSANVAGLLSDYTVVVSDEPVTLYTEDGVSGLSLTMYPGVQADAMGNLSLTCTPAAVTEENADGYEGWYYRYTDGRVYRFEGVARSRI